jgi:HSP20 family protein
MKLRSLIPFRDRDSIRPEVSLFGTLHREIDHLFEDFSRGLGAQGALSLAPSIDIAEAEK